MPYNVLDVGPQIFALAVGAIVLFVAAFAFAIRHRPRVPSGVAGRRREETSAEVVSPDGFIDSFAGVAEEAGGSLPLIARVIIYSTLVVYFAYLVLFWQPR